jgi:serine/threonine-protein kinase HipA
MVVLAVAVGNLDLHAKNLSLIHRIDGTITLAAAYDIVPQTHFPNDQEMALAVNGEYRHAALTSADLVAELTTWGIDDAEALVRGTLTAVRDAVAAEQPDRRAYTNLRADIDRFITNLLAGHPAGA